MSKIYRCSVPWCDFQGDAREAKKHSNSTGHILRNLRSVDAEADRQEADRDA